MTTIGLVMLTSPISQPASIISRLEFDKIGGISSEYRLAFEQDLLSRLVLDFGTRNLVKIFFARFRVTMKVSRLVTGKLRLGRASGYEGPMLLLP